MQAIECSNTFKIVGSFLIWAVKFDQVEQPENFIKLLGMTF
jgi:hypothetical protein